MRLLSLLILWLVSISIYAQDYIEVASDQNISGTFGEAGFYGGGLSFVDFNQDGLDDLSFSSDDGQDIYFYQNTGNGFIQLSNLVNFTGVSRQILWVDYDNDGDNDLFVAAKDSPNKFYRNEGNMSMTDISASCGINFINDNTVAAAFCDVNLDGFLDLYVANSELANTNFLYLNNGAGGFYDNTTASGVGDGQKLSLAVSFFDYDDDGDSDLFVANDKFTPNSMYENNGNGIFSDISVSSGIYMVFDAMNAGMGDCNMDGLLDIYVTNGPAGNVLYGNNGNGTFSNIAESAGVTMNKVCWGANFFDFDNDMDEDLYVCASNTPSNQANILYRNNGSGFFTPVAPNGFPGDSKPSFSNAIGDFNNDGKLDIAVSNDTDVPFQLWQNIHVSSNNWAKLKLIGTTSNLSAIGSKLDIRIGGEHRYLQTYCGQAFQSQNADYVFFGSGTNQSIDSIFIHWPSGTVDLFKNVACNQKSFLREGSSGYNPPLPLYLNFIKAHSQGANILVEWEIFSALGVRNQQLQRSLDGRHFETLNHQYFKGNENYTQRFSYLDKSAIIGENYFYRLKNIEQDGTVSYSKLVTATIEFINEEIFSIIGNPIQERLLFYSKEKLKTTLKFEIFNQASGFINSLTEELINTQQISIDVNNLNPGLYFLRVYGWGAPKSLPFVKI